MRKIPSDFPLVPLRKTGMFGALSAWIMVQIHSLNKPDNSDDTFNVPKAFSKAMLLLRDTFLPKRETGNETKYTLIISSKHCILICRYVLAMSLNNPNLPLYFLLDLIFHP